MGKPGVRLFAKMDVEALRLDPRFVSVGAAGFVVFWRGVAYAKEILSDGFIDRDSLPFVTIGLKDAEVRNAVKALLGTGLWREVDGGYATPEGWWLENQVTAEQVAAKRESDADRKRKERERRQSQDDRKSGLASQEGHKPVTRDTGRDSDVSHAPVTSESREGTEDRGQRTEILPGGSIAGATAAAAEMGLVPLKRGWEPFSDWLNEPGLNRKLAEIEGRRSPEILTASRRKSEMVREVLLANHLGVRELVAVLSHPEAQDWKGLDPEAVMRVWQIVQDEGGLSGIPGANLGVNENDREALLRAEMARMGR